MNKVAILTFIFGAALGSVATWMAVKTKYQQEARNEIREMREWVADKAKEKGIEDKVPEGITIHRTSNEKPDLFEYAKKINEAGYTNYNKTGEEQKEEKNVSKPYVISPDEYGGLKEYDCMILNHFADGVLTDDWDVEIEDVEGTVGADYADHFGDYEEDVVHIRNDELQMDYEILRDNRNFADVVQEND